MSEPFDTLAADMAEAMGLDLDAPGLAALSAVLEVLQPDVLTQLQQSLTLLSRFDGWLSTNGPPSNILGTTGSVAYDLNNYVLYGPKHATTGWGAGRPMTGVSVFDIWRAQPGNANKTEAQYFEWLANAQIDAVMAEIGPLVASALASENAAMTARDEALAEAAAAEAAVAYLAPFVALFGDSVPTGFKFALFDQHFAMAAGLRDDGTWETHTSVAAVMEALAVVIGAASFGSTDHVGYRFGIADANGAAAVALRDDGTWEVDAMVARTINGRPVDQLGVERKGGAYPYQIGFVNNTGESLAEGSTGAAITTAQEYDNVCWPARTTTGGPLLPMTVANGQYAARGENPMFGACGRYKALIESENGLKYQDNDFVLLGCNNGYSGFKLAQISKGTVPYTAMMSQASALVAYGAATGKSVGVLATILTAGANDGNPASLTPTPTFKTGNLTFASDYDADVRAITGQTRRVVTIINQLSSRAPQLAVAQLECAQEHPLIYLAGPMYQYGYYDSLHINPAGERAMGELDGKVKKRVITDGVDWEPLQPQRAWVSGSNIYVAFNKSDLLIDTTDAIVAVQPRYGFDCLDGASAAVAQSANPVVVGRDALKLTFASSAVAQSVVKVRGAHLASTGRSDFFVGGSTNLRDRDGNWCVVFSLDL